MSALFLALALFAAQDAAAETPPPAAAPAAAAAAQDEAPFPPGAPRDDYGLVAWCYGVLDGYLRLHDEVMPEVTRIESAFRRPGSSLEEDLAVYAQMQEAGRSDLQRLARAMEAAEKASPRPISEEGAAALNRGRSVWAAGPEVTKARLAQEWMSWTPPARCAPTAARLEERSTLLGAAFQSEPAPTASIETPE